MITVYISAFLFLGQAFADECTDLTSDCSNPTALKAICANSKISYFCKKSCNLCPKGPGDPCLKGNHKEINDPHRSALFVPESTDRLLCDRVMETDWYIFGGNDEMPTQCVQMYHCGTHAPIWMLGSHPSVRDGIVHREACANLGYPISAIKCCDIKLPIQVKNCGTFFVYYLSRSPGCSMAYCAGNKTVCNVGSTGYGTNCTGSDLFIYEPHIEYETDLVKGKLTILKLEQVIGNSFKTLHPAWGLYPKLTTFPKLGNPEVTPNKTVRFPCTIDYPKRESGVSFEVTWTVDGHELRDPLTHRAVVSVLTGVKRTAYLNVDKLQGNLDKYLRCNVTSFHTSTPGVHSDPIPSNPYFVGFKVSTDSVVVDEKGDEKTITIESTLPIPCNALSQYDCKFPIEIHQGKDPIDLSWKSCTYDLKKDPIDGKYRTTITVKATRDFITDHDKVHDIAFKPLFSLMNPVWMGYNISHIHVKTLDADVTDCTSSGDPHLRGFTHKKMYNAYQEGDFLLYGTKNNSRPFEVHVRNWGCGRYHPCTCAVVAREGNDVIEIDMCEKRLNEIAAPLLKKLSTGPLDGTIVARDQSGKHFYINFPSGTRIEVAAHIASPKGTNEKDGYLTVHMQAPEDDLGKTEGLCGNWLKNPDPVGALEGKDGVKYTDKQTDQFTTSWNNVFNFIRLTPNTSMFDKIHKPDTHLKLEHQYCYCKEKTVDCTKGLGADNPNKKVCARGKCLTPTFNQNIIRRDIADDYMPENVKAKKHVRRDATFPTPSGITESGARSMCTSAIRQSTLYHLCQHMSVLQIDSFIDACVEDIKFADGDLFTISHMNAFDMVCQTEVMKDVTRYQYNSDGVPIPPIEITFGRCPDQCSRHGTCIRGVCHCNNGYTSVDCSVSVGVAPKIHRLRWNGICDIRSQRCSNISVIAENIMDSNTLLCKMQLFHINGSLQQEVSTKAEFINFLEVSCSVPPNSVTLGTSPTQIIKVSLTNDDKAYSSMTNLIIYDSLCYQCDKDGNCSRKTDTCLINGKCHLKGEHDHLQKICDPLKNPNGWSVISSAVHEIDHYTASYTGCACSFDMRRFDCACCQFNGCQCGEIQSNQCTSCQRKDLCGKFPDLFPVV